MPTRENFDKAFIDELEELRESSIRFVQLLKLAQITANDPHLTFDTFIEPGSESRLQVFPAVKYFPLCHSGEAVGNMLKLTRTKPHLVFNGENHGGKSTLCDGFSSNALMAQVLTASPSGGASRAIYQQFVRVRNWPKAAKTESGKPSTGVRDADFLIEKMKQVRNGALVVIDEPLARTSQLGGTSTICILLDKFASEQKDTNILVAMHGDGLDVLQENGFGTSVQCLRTDEAHQFKFIDGYVRASAARLFEKVISFRNLDGSQDVDSLAYYLASELERCEHVLSSTLPVEELARQLKQLPPQTVKKLIADLGLIIKE